SLPLWRSCRVSKAAASSRPAGPGRSGAPRAVVVGRKVLQIRWELTQLLLAWSPKPCIPTAVGWASPETGIRTGARGSAERPVLTCVVADDHPAVLEAIAALLVDSGVDVVARARDGDEALAEIEAQRPQVALVDIRMPRLGGIEIARRAKRSAPETAV